MLVRRLALLMIWLLLPVGFCAAANNPAATLRQANRLSNLFNWADAGPLYAQAERSFAAAGDKRDALYAKFGRIRSEMETLNLPETSDYLGSELQTPLLRHDLRLRLMCLIVKGDIDGEIDSEPASADWREALSVAKKLHDRKWESRASAELGFQEFVQGDVGAAMKAVGTALITAHNTGDVGAEIRYLGAIGTGLALRRLNGQAISYLDKAIALAKLHPDTGYPFFPIAGKVQALINEHEYRQALMVIAQSENEAKSKHKQIKLAQLLLFKSDIALARQQRPEAIAILNKAAKLCRENRSRLFAGTEIKLAAAYREQHDLQKAKEAATAAVAATGGSRDMYLAPARLRALAEVDVALGEPDQAARLYQRASDIVEGMISNAPDRPGRAALLAEMSPIFSEYFAIAARRNNSLLAFHIIEQVRGRVLAESLLQPKLKQPADTETEDRIRRLKVELVKAQSARRRHDLINRLFFAEQARWTKLSGRPVPIADPASEVTLSEVQRELRRHEVILEYVLGEPTSFCLAIDRSGARIVRLPGRKEVERLAARYLTDVKGKHESANAGHSLFAAILEPLTLPPTQTSLIIVPDGILNLVPFSALKDASGRYVIDHHTIWYLPSAGTLVLLRRTQTAEAPRMFLGVGGVEYGPGSAHSSSLAQTKSRLTRGAYYGVDVANLPDLPGTQEEIRSAARALGAAKPVLQSGIEATETAFKSEPLDRFRIIHLAIHGKANPKYPDRAALIFRPDPPLDDGFLEPREILGLHLNADMVVLSSCETAVGHLQGEEGIADLARTFLSVGAKSVVSTLWQIDDAYSLFLMKRFYTHLREGMTEAVALADSQKDLLSKFGRNTPVADWAAFTLLGDGDRAIFAKTQTEESSR